MLGAEVTMSRWIRKSELDAKIGRDTPVPTEVISNEEYAPPPQTRAQREVERRLDEILSPLTREAKRKNLGLSAARVYGVDPEARRNPLPGDYVDRLKRLAAEAGFTERSNLQYGWVLR